MIKNDDTKGGDTMTRNRNATPVTEELEMIETEVEADEVEAEDTFSAKALATELGTDPKSFRRWLRNYTKERANKGGRWVFTADRKAELIAAYNARNETPAEAAEEAPAEEA